MAFDPVPLAIGGGAEVSDETMRVAVNAFTGDSQGIVLPGDFKVTALAQPGAAVNIAPGGMVLRAPQSPGESYVGRAATPTQEARSLTNAGYHLIVARVVDPDKSPWQPSGTPGAPNTSIPNGPYFMPHVIPGVSASTERADQVVSYAAEALALVKNPSGLGVITDGMIQDLRRLYDPKVGFAFDIQQGPGTVEFITVTETAWHDWPTNGLLVDVPRWATHAQVAIRMQGIAVDGPGDVNWRVNAGGATGPITYFDYNGNSGTPAGFVETKDHTAYGEFDVRFAQGQRIIVRPQARRTYEVQNKGNIWIDSNLQVEFDVRFSQRVV